MDFIFTADLHGNISQYQKVFSYAKKNHIQTIVFGGDLTPKNPELRHPVAQKDFLKTQLFPMIKDFNGNVLLIMGNDDYKANHSFLKENQSIGFCLIDDRPVVIDNFTFVGYSYVPYTPFVWKDWEKKDLEKDNIDNLRSDVITDGFISQGNDNHIPYSILTDMKQSSIEDDLRKQLKSLSSDKLILITHTPPFDTNCDCIKDEKTNKIRHIGSLAVRKIIEEKQPLFSLHGHIHNTFDFCKDFKTKIGRTVAASASNDHNPQNPYILRINTDTLIVERIKI